MAYFDPWDKPSKDPRRMDPDLEPFTGDPRWLREKRAREQRELLEIIRRKMLEPIERKPERGDYLVYYLGGPNNATQEYFWDKILPKDNTPWQVPEPPLFPSTPSEPNQPVIRTHRYKLVIIPQNETPFATVQVYLALYQEPPL